MIFNFKSAAAGFIAIASLVLTGCIGSPLPGGTVGALYHWDDLSTPVLTTVGLENGPAGGRFDGGFDLSSLPLTHPELKSPPDQPWLFEACGKQTCYSIVLFPGDFGFDDDGKLTGVVAMNAMTTLLANEVRGFRADTVRATLDVYSEELMVKNRSYAALIRQDFHHDPESRQYLLDPKVYKEALSLHRRRQDAGIGALLGSAPLKTADLNVPQDFEFDSSWDLRVDVDLPALREKGGYLLLCSDFENDGPRVSVDYASCPLKAPLLDGAWQGAVKLTGSVSSLAAVVLPLDNPNEPKIAYWDRNRDGDRLLFTE